jgi:hypothetical protein
MPDSYDLNPLDPNTFEHLVIILPYVSLGSDLQDLVQVQMVDAMDILKVKLHIQVRQTAGLDAGTYNQSFTSLTFPKLLRNGY